MGKPTVDPGGESQQDRFAKLIRQHYEVLYRAAYRLTRSSVDAEDLVQEVCLRAYPRLTEVEALEQPRGWLLPVSIVRRSASALRAKERAGDRRE
jgi:RNA polymerase sigma factor (sigma-70 family)